MSAFQTVPQLFQARVDRHGPATLLIDALDGSERTYQQVHVRARRWAQWFLEQGWPVGGRLAAALPNSLEFAELFLGAALAGVTLCPFNPALADPELINLVERLGARALLTTAPRAAALAGRAPVPVLSLGFKGTFPANLPEPAETLPDVEPGTPLVLIMTSGTTGGVKACRITHANVCWTAEHTAAAFGFHPGTRYLTPLPLFHINAQVVGLLAAITAGSAVALGPRLPGPKLMDAVARTGAHGLSTVPAMIHDLLEQGVRAPTCLQFVVCSSAPLPRHWQESFQDRHHVPVLYCYGLSEAACFATYSPRHRPVPLGSAGVPLGTEIQLVDGEITLRGKGIFPGYDGDLAATAAALRDGWLFTGDQGRLDEAGNLFVVGRTKEMINRGGEKVAPAAVEAVLLQHPAVAECVVFPVEDARLGEEVGAAVVLKQGNLVDDDALWDHCQERLADFEVPKRIFRVTELPRGGTGKVLRRVVQQQLGRAQHD